MNGGAVTLRGGPIFDGTALHSGWALRLEAGKVAAIGPEDQVRIEGQAIDLEGDILSPGFVDLQVNGGGGRMLGDAPGIDTLRVMAGAHRALGATTILPTLITDRPETTGAAIAAVREVLAAGVPGIAGLHLEGPHLSQARKGAHDGALIRSMEREDLALLVEAARALPVLMVTVAPEAVTPEQVAALAGAGAVVMLGHTDAGFETCRAYVRAGARGVTHLFNAMRQMGSREPGVVGAALATGALSAGLIADGHHVHPEVMRAAWAAKRGPGEIFLVSDAMAVAGTEMQSFRLGDREIRRQGGRLKLADGTLAGADLALLRAVRLTVEEVGLPLDRALRAATATPAAFAGLPAGVLRAGAPADPIRIAADLSRCAPLF